MDGHTRFDYIVVGGGAAGCVNGIENLFVADASAIPEPPSGFSHLPTLMLAERISEVVAKVR